MELYASVSPAQPINGGLNAAPNSLTPYYWGNIGGTLSNQEDLQAALDEKYEKPASGIPSSDLASNVLAPYRTNALQNMIDKPLINQWDEQWRNGYYTSQGAFVSDANYIANKNRIEVKSNTSYYFETQSQQLGRVCWYDASGSFISTQLPSSPAVLTSPANAKYLDFDMKSGYGSVYNNDISVNYPSVYTDYYPSALPKTNAHVGMLGNAIGMRGWNQLCKNKTFSNTATDTKNYFNLQIWSYQGISTHIGMHIDKTYSTIGKITEIFTCSYNGNILRIKHNGSTQDISIDVVYCPHSVGDKFIFTCDINGVNPSAVGGLSLGNIQLFNLTALFGAGNEPTTVDEFRKMFPANYYPYCSGGWADLLWTNESPSSSFAPQVIYLDLSNYSHIVVDFRIREGDSPDYISSVAMIMNESYAYAYPEVTYEDGIHYFRPMLVNSSWVSFASGRKNVSYGTTYQDDNSHMIPYKIYGIR